MTPENAARLKAAYDEAKAEGSGPGVPRSELQAADAPTREDLLALCQPTSAAKRARRV